MTGVLAHSDFAALGTNARVVVTDDDALGHALEIVRAEVAAVDAACSRFRPDSELVALNAAAGRPMTVSPVLLSALAVALRAAKVTSGAVSPTVGTAMRVLGYDRDFALVDRHGPALALAARPVPAWQLIELDSNRRAVRLPAGTQIDLGATAKALCADRAALSAAACIGCGVLVSLGGDIAVAGAPPAQGWAVRVADRHDAPDDGPGQTVRIDGGGLATSGTAIRRWQRGEQLLHHLIDPASGQPAGTTWRTVSVAASCCVDANIASTAAVVLGSEGPAWLRARGLPARLVSADGSITVVGPWPPEDGPGGQPW